MSFVVMRVEYLFFDFAQVFFHVFLHLFSRKTGKANKTSQLILRIAGLSVLSQASLARSVSH